MTALQAKLLVGFAAIAVVLLAAVVVAAYVLLPASLSDIEDATSEPVEVSNPVTEVTVANPVDTVTVANPVREVTISNPVDEVKVTNIVETAAPRDASLWGYCYPDDHDGYQLSVVAFSGGIEKVVASGSYVEDAANQIGLEIADYYFGDGLGLTFGAQSEDCAHLDGWSAQ